LHHALLLSGLVSLDYSGKPEKKQIQKMEIAIMGTPKGLLYWWAGTTGLG